MGMILCVSCGEDLFFHTRKKSIMKYAVAVHYLLEAIQFYSRHLIFLLFQT